MTHIAMVVSLNDRKPWDGSHTAILASYIARAELEISSQHISASCGMSRTV